MRKPGRARKKHGRVARVCPSARQGPGRVRACWKDQPPATAGMMETWTPDGVAVSRLSTKRTSSSPT
ncbi:hypothetical protein SAMN05216276_11363 [Streptosporangium subroseum]|uniref:Uncharacterized protein n=1 Tax=Streptosporangium subroseum TaxID=106412 RepID=A0A239PCX5_9ACTN|nr:hypothetical protein SAMN05216276_11363 [Streptosporangium subroseum]